MITKGADIPIKVTPAGITFLRNTPKLSLPEVSSIMSMSPNSIANSERNIIIAEPEAHINLACCFSSQKRRAKSAKIKQKYNNYKILCQTGNVSIRYWLQGVL